MRKTNNNIKGFTLVEIMIVVSIIAVLSAIAIPQIVRSRVNANEARAKSTLRAIMSSAESYRTVNPTYPPELSDLSDAQPPYMSDAICGDGSYGGYEFDFTGGGYTYTATASPTTPGSTGENYFYGDQGGAVVDLTPEEVEDEGGDVAAAGRKKLQQDTGGDGGIGGDDGGGEDDGGGRPGPVSPGI